jgi:beta-glucanase (GH16 family)
VEARIKLPGGLGLWPAFWMLPSDGSIAGCSGCGRHGGWPSSGEIDIMEAANAMRSTIATIHYGGPWPLHVQSSGSYSLGGASLADTFHVWGIVWTTTQVRGCAVRAEPASAT